MFNTLSLKLDCYTKIMSNIPFIWFLQTTEIHFKSNSLLLSPVLHFSKSKSTSRDNNVNERRQLH